MKQKQTRSLISRRSFSREVVSLAGVGAIGASAICLGTSSSLADERSDEHAEEQGHAHHHKGYFEVGKLPFHLQHEFQHSISCNNVVAKSVDVQIADGVKKQHAILQRPGTFGWGTVTFFLQLDESLIGQDMTFYSNVGWSPRSADEPGHAEPGGPAKGEVVFSVDINGDIVVDGGRSTTGAWVEIQRLLRVRTREMRLTLMLDSIGGNNNFDFWWGEPQLIPGGDRKKDHDDH